MMDRTILLLVMEGLAVLLAALSIPLLLGKVKRNGVYGVRTPATLRDDAVWYSVNARWARVTLFQSAALAVLAAVLYAVPSISFDTYASWVLGTFMISLIVISVWALQLDGKSTASEK